MTNFRKIYMVAIVVGIILVTMGIVNLYDRYGYDFPEKTKPDSVSVKDVSIKLPFVQGEISSVGRYIEEDNREKLLTLKRDIRVDVFMIDGNIKKVYWGWRNDGVLVVYRDSYTVEGDIDFASVHSLNPNRITIRGVTVDFPVLPGEILCEGCFQEISSLAEFRKIIWNPHSTVIRSPYQKNVFEKIWWGQNSSGIVFFHSSKYRSESDINQNELVFDEKKLKEVTLKNRQCHSAKKTLPFKEVD